MTARVYLDNAATSFPKPPAVVQAVCEILQQGAGTSARGSHEGARTAGEVVNQSRGVVARMLGTTVDASVAFTSGCTDGLNLLLAGLLRPGDRVVTSTLEHNSVLRPLHELSQKLDLHVEHVPFDRQTGFVNAGLWQAALERPTRLAVLTGASNVLGTCQDVFGLFTTARNAGALTLLDAAQTAGHSEVSLEALPVDFAVASGHKGCMGPLGIGIVYVRSGCEEHLQPVRCGGTGYSSLELTQPRRMPDLFESGSLNLPGIAGLRAALLWLESDEASQLRQQQTELFGQVLSELRDVSGITCYPFTEPPSDRRQPVLSLNLDGVACHDVAEILDQSFGISVRGGFHCAPLVHQQLGTAEVGGTLRLSLGLYNSAEDSTAVVNALKTIRAGF